MRAETLTRPDMGSPAPEAVLVGAPTPQEAGVDWSTKSDEALAQHVQEAYRLTQAPASETTDTEWQAALNDWEQSRLEQARRSGDSSLLLAHKDAEAGTLSRPQTEAGAPAEAAGATWDDVSNQNLGTILRNADRILHDASATDEQRGHAAEVWRRAKEQQMLRVGEVAMDLADVELAVADPAEMPVGMTGQTETAEPPKQPEAQTLPSAEAYFDSYSDEELPKIRSMLMNSLVESTVSYDKHRKYTPDLELRGQRKEQAASDKESFDRVCRNLMSLQRVTEQREHALTGEPEPFRGTTPEGIIYPTKLNPAAVKEFADALFASNPDDVYGILLQMRNNFNFNPIPGEDSLTSAERTMLFIDVCTQLVKDERPGWEQSDYLTNIHDQIKPKTVAPVG